MTGVETVAASTYRVRRKLATIASAIEDEAHSLPMPSGPTRLLIARELEETAAVLRGIERRILPAPAKGRLR